MTDVFNRITAAGFVLFPLPTHAVFCLEIQT